MENDGTTKTDSPREDPLVSIVIPAFNRKDELLRCLASIQESTYRNHEVIVVNNSEDPAVLQAVESRFPSVRTIDLHENTGIRGLNVGFENATGEYIFGIDDDCGVRPDTLEQIVKEFDRLPDNVGAIQCTIYNPLNETWPMRSTPERPLDDIVSIAEGSTAFKREVFERVGYYDDAFFCWQHGPDLSLRMLGAGYHIRFSDNVILDHYEKRATVRPRRAFLESRNMAWLNIKQFSPIFFPLLVARNLVSLLAIPIRQRSLFTGLCGLTGYLVGWLTFPGPLRKRRTASLGLQKSFILFYAFNRTPNREKYNSRLRG